MSIKIVLLFSSKLWVPSVNKMLVSMLVLIIYVNTYNTHEQSLEEEATKFHEAIYTIKIICLLFCKTIHVGMEIQKKIDPVKRHEQLNPFFFIFSYLL